MEKKLNSDLELCWCDIYVWKVINIISFDKVYLASSYQKPSGGEGEHLFYDAKRKSARKSLIL